MTTTPEGRVKKLVKDIIKAVPNTYAHWPVMNGMGAPTLDCVGARPFDGKMFAVETKAPGQRRKITQRQVVTGCRMRLANVVVFIIDGDGEDAALFRGWLGYALDSESSAEDMRKLEAHINERFRELVNQVLGGATIEYEEAHT
jgi:predicted DNA-binding transcriptional regulator